MLMTSVVVKKSILTSQEHQKQRNGKTQRTGKHRSIQLTGDAVDIFQSAKVHHSEALGTGTAGDIKKVS